MKFNKIYSALASAVALMGFCSCSDDVTDPVFQKPDQATTNFAIYAPAFQNQTYELSFDGTFEVNLNQQPEYGYSAVTQYRLDVCLDDKFEDGKFETLVPMGSGTMLAMTFRDRDLAAALTAFQGATKLEEYTDLGLQKVYLRGRAFVEGVEGSEIVTKNIETLNNVQSFYYVPTPAKLYVVGNYAIGTMVGGVEIKDWIAPLPANEDALNEFALSEPEDGVGSKKFYGQVDFNQNAPVFRFYTALGSWDENSYGAAGGEDADKPVVFEDFTGAETFEGDITKTKDSFSFPNCPGGVLNMEVDMSDMKKIRIKITPAE